VFTRNAANVYQVSMTLEKASSSVVLGPAAQSRGDVGVA